MYKQSGEECYVPDNVAKSYKLFQKAKRDFVKLAHKMESALKKDKERLSVRLKRTNTRIAKQKDKLSALEKRIAVKSTAARKRQVKNLKSVLAREKEVAQELRLALSAVAEKLRQAREHVVHARFIEKGSARIENEIDKHLSQKKKTRKKAVKKKSIKKKTIKKNTVKKKSTAKKNPVRKKSLKTKNVNRNVLTGKQGKKGAAKKKAERVS
jgi:hypothetical protein